MKIEFDDKKVKNFIGLWLGMAGVLCGIIGGISLFIWLLAFDHVLIAAALAVAIVSTGFALSEM